MFKTIRYFILCSVILLPGCGRNSVVNQFKDRIQTDLQPLSERYTDHFAVGAAVEAWQLQEGEGALLAYHFNSLTAENAMKFKSIHPEPDVYSFEAADELSRFARQHKMEMRGHTFVWHHPAEIAPWVFSDDTGRPRTREEVLDILHDHMSALFKRYGKHVKSWDVVNEAIDASEADNLRRTEWYNSIGPDYVEQAFLMAHEIDPDARLFLNEYDTFEPQKREALYQYVKGLLERDIPIHGVGLQMHLTLSHPEVDEIQMTIARFRDLGLEIHITELDMSLYLDEFESFDTAPEDHLIRQAHRYKDIFRIFEENADVIGSVTFWGFNDGHTFRTGEPYNRNDWPLPFDSGMQKKIAYDGIIQSENLPEDVVIKKANPQMVYSAPKGSPVIDGVIENEWDRAPVVQTATQVMSSPGAVADVRVLWDENSVYVLAEVADPHVSSNAQYDYMNDSFEVFLDELNDKSASLGEDDYQFRIGYQNSLGFGGWARHSFIESAARLTDSGYLVELKIDLQQVKGEAGRMMGIDFQVNDNYSNACREGISKWNDPTNESWRNTEGWGSLLMVE
ncbi:MAG: endo-1,4-beta-xylanase [Spirochaetales bacterium]|nr:endo-1,4-beta-xylanase [Spirochaetales bacterium]